MSGAAVMLLYPEDVKASDARVAEYCRPAGGGWSPALVVLAGVVGVLMWGGLLVAALQIYGLTCGVVGDAASGVGLML